MRTAMQPSNRSGSADALDKILELKKGTDGRQCGRRWSGLRVTRSFTFSRSEAEAPARPASSFNQQLALEHTGH